MTTKPQAVVLLSCEQHFRTFDEPILIMMGDIKVSPLPWASGLICPSIQERAHTHVLCPSLTSIAAAYNHPQVLYPHFLSTHTLPTSAIVYKS